MATTTNYGWTTPDDTALVKDGAAAIRSLGSAIDSTLKTQIDAQIPDSIIDAKGDLIVGTADNTPAKLTVGTDGYVLTAASGESAGMKWALAAGYHPKLLPTPSGYGFRTPTNGTPGTMTATANRTYYAPIFLSGMTFPSIMCRTGSSWTGTATVRMGIYNCSNTTGKPTTVYLDAGTITASAANTNYVITINNTPPAGWYWLAFNSSAAKDFIGIAGGIQNYLAIGPYASFADQNQTSFWYESSITGAFATAGTITITDSIIFAQLVS